MLVDGLVMCITINKISPQLAREVSNLRNSLVVWIYSLLCSNLKSYWSRSICSISADDESTFAFWIGICYKRVRCSECKKYSLKDA